VADSLDSTGDVGVLVVVDIQITIFRKNSKPMKRNTVEVLGIYGNQILARVNTGRECQAGQLTAYGGAKELRLLHGRIWVIKIKHRLTNAGNSAETVDH